MDLMSWIQQLPDMLRALLVGAGGSFTGGLSASLARSFLGACGKGIMRQFNKPQRQALKVVIDKALHAIESEISNNPKEKKRCRRMFGKWMKREEVAIQFAKLIDPRPGAHIDTRLLRSEFEAQGYSPDALGQGVDFDECVLRFVDEFQNEAAKCLSINKLYNLVFCRGRIW